MIELPSFGVCQQGAVKATGAALFAKRIAFLKAQREQELYERAVIAYNHEVYDQANKYLIIGGVVVAVVGVLIAVAIM